MTLRIEDAAGWSAGRLGDAWPSIIACAERFVAEMPDEVSIDYLIGVVQSGQGRLWIVFDEDTPNTAILTVFAELKHYLATGVSFVEITGIGGSNIREAMPLLDVIEAWGKAQGADHAVVTGRRGWSSLLKDHGYREKSITLTKRLD